MISSGLCFRPPVHRQVLYGLESGVSIVLRPRNRTGRCQMIVAIATLEVAVVP